MSYIYFLLEIFFMIKWIKDCLIFMWRSKGADDASKYHQAQFSDSDLPGNIFFQFIVWIVSNFCFLVYRTLQIKLLGKIKLKWRKDWIPWLMYYYTKNTVAFTFWNIFKNKSVKYDHVNSFKVILCVRCFCEERTIWY